jgi:hypothetical protein
MGDEDESNYKVEYLDGAEGQDPEVFNWVARAGKARVTYADGSTFEGACDCCSNTVLLPTTCKGSFDSEKLKMGYGVYIWMEQEVEDEARREKARYEGQYWQGKRQGAGKLTYPNGDIYHGEFVDNQVEHTRTHSILPLTHVQIHGQGTYTYKASGDVYSGMFEHGTKQGEGIYEFGADQSQLIGQWEHGELPAGSWRFKATGQYDGAFKGCKPIGEGRFSFVGGIVQEGEYVEVHAADAEDDAPTQLVWRGKSVVHF